MTSAAEQLWRRVSRRDCLRIGTLPLLGAATGGLFSPAVAGVAQAPAARRCILIWLDGGPSHLETFDPKPDAPAEIRGPFRTISTAVPGVSLSEHLPRTAQLLSQVAIIRSMTSTLGEHNLGSHYLLTGIPPSAALTSPSLGAVLTHLRPSRGSLPAHMSIPDHRREAAAGFLPAAAGPFATGGDPAKPDFSVRDLVPPADLGLDRLTRRREFLNAFNASGEGEASAAEPATQAQAWQLTLSSEARAAFELSRETPQTRDRYGRRTIGQCCLLARRLIETGVSFVTVTDRGWDTHQDLVNRLYEGFTGGSVGKVPSLDLALSALLGDLSERGMLDETLVVVMGEFGRTPKLNTAGGRDHWPRVFSVLLAGGGIRGGSVIGSSDAHGESPSDRPVRPEDLACTLFHQLGIDPRQQLLTPDGRPVVINPLGNPLGELI